MVNRLQGEPASQLRERHDASDFELRTQDKLETRESGLGVARTLVEHSAIESAAKPLHRTSRATAQGDAAGLRGVLGMALGLQTLRD